VFYRRGNSGVRTIASMHRTHIHSYERLVFPNCHKSPHYVKKSVWESGLFLYLTTNDSFNMFASFFSVGVNAE